MVMLEIKHVLWLGSRNGPANTRRLKVMFQKNEIKKSPPQEVEFTHFCLVLQKIILLKAFAPSESFCSLHLLFKIRVEVNLG